MTPVTLVMAYYDNPTMLKSHYKQIGMLTPQEREMVHVVIVDDGSPRWPAREVPREGVDFNLQIYRIDVDVRWNQDAARNIGVAHAETNWVLITDIDHVVPLATWRQLLTRRFDAAIAYGFSRVSAPDFSPYKPHPNSWFMARKLYDAAGGYDERFAGFYGTDGDFRDRVVELAEFVRLKEVLVRVPRQVIPDASTTTYLRKQPEDSAAIRLIKERRAKEEDPSPRRLTFPYHLDFPQGITRLGVEGAHP